MLRHSMRLAHATVLLLDAVAAMVLFVLVSVWRQGDGWREAWLLAGAPWQVWAVAYGLLWAAAEWLQGLHQLRARWTFRSEVADILQAAFVVALVVFSLLFLVRAPDVSRLFLLLLFASQVVFSIVERRLIRAALAVGRRRGIGRRNILVLGTSPAAKAMANRIASHPALAYRIVGFLGRPSPACPTVIGALDDVERVVHASIVDEVLAVLDPDEIAYLEPVAFICQQGGKRLRVVFDEGLTPMMGGRVETLGGCHIMTIANGPDRMLGMLVKRLLDVVIATLALLVLAPFLALIALAIRLEDRGPVFFRQTRVGLHGRPFPIVKFRTMVPDAEARLAELTGRNEIEGPAFKVADDPRITRIGRRLRRASLDELPQFWNVLLGQMSVVGPRPPLPGEVSGYDLWHRRRLSMKPGITGLWQVSARLEADFDRWVELDLRYIDRWSLWLDLKIMLRTVPAMLSGR
ncbi:MAG TPA: sugar transferase [Candidatus Limnocylindrales bacterium]|nr:sugar transferase [Candidatus Limnocylindrales bacterium]